MAVLVLTSATTLYGTSWTGTAPGSGNPTVSGTISSSTDLSDHIRQVNINLTSAMQDFTSFADGGYVVNKPGLKSGDITIDFHQDFASGSVDALFGAALLADTLIYLDFKPTSSARGSTNPSYVVACYVSSYTPIGNAVGDGASTSVGFKVTGKPARLTS